MFLAWILQKCKLVIGLITVTVAFPQILKITN